MAKIEVQQIVSIIMFLSIFTIIAVLLFSIIVGTGNDYAVGSLYNATSVLVNDGLADNRSLQFVEDTNQATINYLLIADNIWFFSYVGLAFSMFIAATHLCQTIVIRNFKCLRHPHTGYIL